MCEIREPIITKRQLYWQIFMYGVKRALQNKPNFFFKASLKDVAFAYLWKKNVNFQFFLTFLKFQAN